MRLAYVCADAGIPAFGNKGSSIHLQEVIRTLVRRGVDVDLFTHRLGGDPPSDFERVEVYDIPALHELPDLREHEKQLQSASEALVERLQLNGPYDAVYERYSLWSSAGMTYARASGVPGILEVNAPLIKEQATHRTLLHSAAAESVAARVFGAASTLIAVSDEIATYLRSHTDASRIHVVPNGFDPARFSDADERAPREQSVFTVGFVGSLRPWHGLSVLVEAFAKLHHRRPRSRLLVVGDGPERDRLREDLKRFHVSDTAQLTGAVSPSEVPELLSRIDVAVAPYEQAVGFYFSPLKIFEYMAAGLPVVASRIGQIDGIIENDHTGMLCSPGDSQELAEVLAHLHDHPSLCRRIGRDAREIALQEYSWDARLDAILGHAGIPISRSESAPNDGDSVSMIRRP